MIFGPGEGLVVDGACFSDRDVDDLKGLLDLEKSRDVECRNRDGHIPKLTPRIFVHQLVLEYLLAPRCFQPNARRGDQSSPLVD